MTFVLSNQNVFEYLRERAICSAEEEANSKIELKYAKNFNLLVTLTNGRTLLIKQEPHTPDGKTSGEFLQEWCIHEFLRQFPHVSQMRPWISEAIYFDAENSIIVFNYLSNYRDLMDFYAKENIFPTDIPTAIGTSTAKIHRLTFKHQDYQEFFTSKQREKSVDFNKNIIRKLGKITPEIFGLVPADGIKFYTLYQRYDSLGQAIAEIHASLTPCCLTHNDLKLNNILLFNDWQTIPVNHLAVNGGKKNEIVRLIDWERCSWGDPAFDLGTLIGSYLLLWLGSLMTSRDMSIDESLRMATTPLEELQPSMAALVRAYVKEFPEILEHRGDFLRRVIQFSGWNLINAIQSTLQYQKSFGNTGICMLQVAKSLLCRPESSIPTLFGTDILKEITPLSFSL
ncbi:hypothetical protein NIES4071_53480 [Calothrix sp. NIES-4071]|nr:hypothetical protein NIES4071_53480 [Calothrix sp. NIES-4071]BAZ59656.1 hypothetical protein NIES4105_53430 [Calothrix sp. NIES-4105]